MTTAMIDVQGEMAAARAKARSEVVAGFWAGKGVAELASQIQLVGEHEAEKIARSQNEAKRLLPDAVAVDDSRKALEAAKQAAAKAEAEALKLEERAAELRRPAAAAVGETRQRMATCHAAAHAIVGMALRGEIPEAALPQAIRDEAGKAKLAQAARVAQDTQHRRRREHDEALRRADVHDQAAKNAGSAEKRKYWERAADQDRKAAAAVKKV